MRMSKKCPKCGGSTEIFARGLVDFHPDSGGPVQELKLNSYKCKRCGNLFSDNLLITSKGKIRNMRVNLRRS